MIISFISWKCFEISIIFLLLQMKAHRLRGVRPLTEALRAYKWPLHDSDGTPHLPPKLTIQTVIPKAFDDEVMIVYTFFAPRRSPLPITRITSFLRKVSERLLEVKPFEHLNPEVLEGSGFRPSYLGSAPPLNPFPHLLHSLPGPKIRERVDF